MKGEGTAAQVALLWSQDSGCLEAPKSQPLTLVLVGNKAQRGPGPSHRSRIQSTRRFYPLKGKTKGSEYKSQAQALYSSRNTLLFYCLEESERETCKVGVSSLLTNEHKAGGTVTCSRSPNQEVAEPRTWVSLQTP